MQIHPLILTILLIIAGAGVFYQLLPFATHPKAEVRIKRKIAEILLWWKIATRYGTELGGFVHDDTMSQWLPPTMAGFSAGTWTLTVASNVWSQNRTAADANFTIFIPIVIPSNSAASREKGFYLKSIEVMYSIGTADMDDMASVTLYKNTLQATAASGSGTLNTAASVTTTIDSGHDTAAERKVQDEHRMVITLSTPAWIDNDEAYHLELVCDAAATSVFKYFGSIVNYTSRL